MAQGAQIQPDQEPFVLLISDRPDEMRALERGITVAMACRSIGLGTPLPAGRPHLAVLDLARDGIAAAETALAARGAIPRLILDRNGTKPAAPAATTRSLPAGAPRQIILARIFAMIEAETRAVGERTRRLQASGAAATAIVADLFDCAALGAGLQQDVIDQGTAIVLEAVSEAGVKAWLEIVWQHDFGIYQHTLSVAGYAGAFGGLIGLSLADRHRLAKAALLHDIGKSRIPVDILNKPDALTPEEWRLMQRHPSIGADLLLGQGGFDPAIVSVVRHHHERLDGTGYPDGLAGSAIGDLVRVVAICDVFSALTERRPYRQPTAAAEALTIMERSAGHLDPALLRAFRPVGLREAMEPAA